MLNPTVKVRKRGVAYFFGALPRTRSPFFLAPRKVAVASISKCKVSWQGSFDIASGLLTVIALFPLAAVAALRFPKKSHYPASISPRIAAKVSMPDSLKSLILREA